MTAIGVGAQIVWPDVIDIPAGTQPSNPLVSALSNPDMIVDAIEVQFLTGPGGNVGWYVAYAGTPIIPFGAGTPWVVVDEFLERYPVAAEWGKSATIVAYNVGNFDHTMYVRVIGVPVAVQGVAAGGAPVAPIDFGSGGG